MLNEAFGLIYTGENNPKLKELTLTRSVAAVPFGGRYRCIDFILSSLVNSGVQNVGLITQKNYHSLMDHLGSGKEWDLHRKHGGLFMLPPFLTKDNTGLYRGSVDALRSVLGFVRRCSERYVILSGSHTIFNTTFYEMLEYHKSTGADITMMYNDCDPTDPEDQNNDLRLCVDENGRINDIELDPYRPRTRFASCDVYIMEKTLLEYLVEEAYSRGEYDFIRDVILKKCRSLRMMGWRYDGYIARLDSLGVYYKRNMDLLDKDVARELFTSSHPVYTKVKDEVPAKFGAEANVSNCLAADGCVIDGAVSNSVLFRGVHINKGAKVTDSVILQAATIGEGAVLKHVVLDKGVIIRPNRVLMGDVGYPVLIRKNQVV
ncbi:MAG TPA: glucose-1-phosphate adenylyltransferase subunit GlgD [Eubacteriales bacterium]|nr:glucose-1-phosphate adenylyltransferase subunit GlgD [Clostridia bacterium]HRV73600.1 glucose-1-phosphate adenylyltransferase subunit GlgD [Eubacteriales bacterium]